MCRKCGDVKNVACGRCKGTGSIKSGGIFGFGEPEPSNARSPSCDNCQGRGCFPCPECSKSWLSFFWLFNRFIQDFDKLLLFLLLDLYNQSNDNVEVAACLLLAKSVWELSYSSFFYQIGSLISWTGCWWVIDLVCLNRVVSSLNRIDPLVTNRQ